MDQQKQMENNLDFFFHPAAVPLTQMFSTDTDKLWTLSL